MSVASAETTTGPRQPNRRKTLLGYVPLKSPFYQFHPVTRLVIYLVLGVVPLFIFIPAVNTILILINLILLKWGRVDLSRLRIYLPVIFTVALFMGIVVVLAPGKDPSFTPLEVFGVTIYYQPVFFTFAAYWRLIAMLFGTILYFSLNRERDILVGLRAMRLPFVASYVIGLSVRSAGMFMEDFRIIRQAEQARGLDTSTMKFKDQVKLYMMYLIPLFSIALRRADEISNALFARGYNISGRVATGGKRSDYIRAQYPMRSRDWVAIVALVAVFVAIGVAQMGFGVFAIENSPLNQLLRQWLNIPA